ncbi:MAG: 3-deoxy-D-manno-octulosonic acid transferase [Cyclobacteriaceae bacterium]|nr:3-deoxy-D-manno-octulosonic acid transferase [Cyclobacteriaceae bacterium]MCX7636774.1 3-deoxy-D-manno-octulosonic acid transferase [Cyclobacteriaceae bacterium]MDW8330669.1 glycosyltransferase N-terminal domain-containing protein [Cyclobacteriaceae bacterium]
MQKISFPIHPAIFEGFMVVALYNAVIFILRQLFKLAAFHNSKAMLFNHGRKDFFSAFSTALHNQTQPVIWMHCASLGEFEQGRPVLEALKKEYPSYKILVTFFSPSGYEVRKNYPHADYIFYLPWDTPQNARKFIEISRPVLALFVKYEFWYHYISALHQNNIPLLCISGAFRKEQVFFRWYGGFFRKMLHRFTHFFVQNDSSVELLRSIGIQQVTRSGDTRFDRVWQLTQQQEALTTVELFKSRDKVMVIGSCWPEDLEVLMPFINDQYPRTKFIIAPHEISEELLSRIERELPGRSVRYSIASQMNNPEKYPILIIDNIGMLARLYRYGEYAWVGGAFGKGLHNILEPACFGMPVFFGNKNYRKFPEALDLINRGGAFAIADYPHLKATFEAVNDPGTYMLACEVTRQYVEENRGATTKIMDYCTKLLSK